MGVLHQTRFKTKNGALRIGLELLSQNLSYATNLGNPVNK